MNIEKIKSYRCPIEAAIGAIGGKHKALVVYNLISKSCRYSELEKAIPDVSHRMLSKQLKELEEDEIITRIVYDTVPPKTEYSLTEFGRSLIPVIDALGSWGTHYFEVAGVPFPGTEE